MHRIERSDTRPMHGGYFATAATLMVLLGAYCGRLAPATEQRSQAVRSDADTSSLISPTVTVHDRLDGKADRARFGSSVAVSADGNTAIVGTPGASPVGKVGAGAAHLYQRKTNGEWSWQGMIIEDDPVAGDQFGASVAISADGNVVIVGAPGRTVTSGTDSFVGNGAAYVFMRGVFGWSLKSKLFPDTYYRRANGRFGWSVAISDDGSFGVVGMPYGDFENLTKQRGMAFVIMRRDDIHGPGWISVRPLYRESDATKEFGYSVAIASGSTGTVLVGARLDAGAGAAYLYSDFNDTNPKKVSRLVAADRSTTVSEYFAQSVALSVDGKTALIGAPRTANPATPAGAAYLFGLDSDNVWRQRAKLATSSLATSDEFGSALALSANGLTAFIAAPFESAGSCTKCGAAYLFDLIDNTWTLTQTIKSQEPVSNDTFGQSLSISSSTQVAMVAAPARSVSGFTQNGVVYPLELIRNNGTPCSASAQCESGICVDGVCCNSSCGGGKQNDCQACSVARGGTTDGTCGASRSDYPCRPSVGICDRGELCDGASDFCPGDKKWGPEKVCRQANQQFECDLPEVCSGTANDCPSDDVVKDAGTVCRRQEPDRNPCDKEEVCDGHSPRCPDNALEADGTPCKPPEKHESCVVPGKCQAGRCEHADDVPKGDKRKCGDHGEICDGNGGCSLP